MPVTIPEPVPTVATAVVLLVHVPPGVASASVVVLPTQTVKVPVTGAVVAPGFTVKLLELMLKNTLPVPFTFILDVVDDVPGLGIETLAVPVLGKVPIV